MRRLMPAAFAAVYAVLPLFPSFIVLTAVAFPGVSLVPRTAAIGVLLLVVAIAIYAGITLSRYPKPESQPLLIPIGLWIGAGILSAALGLDPLRGVVFLGVALLGAVWHCSLLRFFGDRGVARAILWSYLLSATAAGAIAVLTVLTRWPAALYATAHGRATGTFVLPGELAAYFIVLLPIAYAVTRIRSSTALRAAAWVALGVGALALVLSYSRAGWMGAAAAAAFVIVTRRGAPRGAAPAAGVIGVALSGRRCTVQQPPRSQRGLHALVDMARRRASHRPLSPDRRGAARFPAYLPVGARAGRRCLRLSRA